MQPVTTDFGVLHFHKVYKGQEARDPVTKERIGATVSVGELTNGSFCHFPKGQPITRPDEARKALRSISDEAVARFDRWWAEETQRLRDEASEPKARPIKIVSCGEAPGSKLVFDDGTEEDVTQAGDVLAYYKQGDALQAFALSIFGARYQQAKAVEVREQTETPRAKMARELEEGREAKRPVSLKQAEQAALRTAAGSVRRGRGVSKHYGSFAEAVNATQEGELND